MLPCESGPRGAACRGASAGVTEVEAEAGLGAELGPRHLGPGAGAQRQRWRLAGRTAAQRQRWRLAGRTASCWPERARGRRPGAPRPGRRQGPCQGRRQERRLAARGCPWAVAPISARQHPKGRCSHHHINRQRGHRHRGHRHRGHRSSSGGMCPRAPSQCCTRCRESCSRAATAGQPQYECWATCTRTACVTTTMMTTTNIWTTTAMTAAAMMAAAMMAVAAMTPTTVITTIAVTGSMAHRAWAVVAPLEHRGLSLPRRQGYRRRRNYRRHRSLLQMRLRSLTSSSLPWRQPGTSW